MNSLPLSESSRSSRQPAALRSAATRLVNLLVWRAGGLLSAPVENSPPPPVEDAPPLRAWAEASAGLVSLARS